MTDHTFTPAQTAPDLEKQARELLALEYERGGRDGNYPTYAELARTGSGAFTLCSIRAVEAALRLASQPPVELDAKRRQELAQRLVYIANSMSEIMSQGFDSKLFVDPEMRDDLLAAAELIATYRRGI